MLGNRKKRNLILPFIGNCFRIKIFFNKEYTKNLIFPEARNNCLSITFTNVLIIWQSSKPYDVYIHRNIYILINTYESLFMDKINKYNRQVAN